MKMNIPVVFDNGINYDNHFIIKEPAKEFEGEFSCPRKNAENTKHFRIKSS